MDMADTKSEIGLITKAVGGDLFAIELLLHSYHSRLLEYIEAKFPAGLRGILEPQDIVQDTWLRAVRAIRSFQPQGSDAFFRWLVTIARNLMTDQLRHAIAAKNAGSLAPMDTTDSSVAQLLSELAVYNRTPSRSAINHELLQALNNALSRILPEQAEALRLRHLDGLSISEVAAQMKRSEGSVLMLCNRALKSLRWEMRSVSLYI
jgi:RNA polymerase sigma-70 factor (ECF subfamily)